MVQWHCCAAAWAKSGNERFTVQLKEKNHLLWWVACSGIQKKIPLSNAKWFQGSSFQGTSFQGSFPNLSVASPWWCVRFFHLEIWKDPSFILPWVSLKTIIKQTSDFFGLLSCQPIPSPLFILAASRPGAVNDCKGLFGVHRPWLVGGPVLDFRMVSHWFNNPIRANWGFLFFGSKPHLIYLKLSRNLNIDNPHWWRITGYDNRINRNVWVFFSSEPKWQIERTHYQYQWFRIPMWV